MLKKHWSNIVLVFVVLLLINPSLKEWFLRTIAFSPSFNSEQEELSSYAWELHGLNTDNFSFDDAKGKVVFVNFWATWCPPCRAELPSIQNLYATYKDDVVFVFVTQEPKEVVVDFFEKNNYDLPVYNAASRIPAQFATTNSIPATYVLNKEGKIVLSKVGAADWDSDKTKDKINQLLSE